MLSLIIASYILLSLYSASRLSKISIFFLITFLSFDFLKTEYLKSRTLILTASFLQLLIIATSVNMCGWEFSFLIPCSVAIFLSNKEKPLFVATFAVLLVPAFFIPPVIIKDYLLISALVVYTEHLHTTFEISRQKYLENIDKLRLLNTQLNRLKSELLESQQYIKQLAEKTQQMKMASSLHDSVGHSLAALNIQLNALKTLLDKKGVLEDDKINQILSSCLMHTQLSYQNLRNFVYSNKASFLSKANYLNNIIENFNFCNVKLVTEGNIEDIPSHVFENLMAILKETLVNVSKHSDATSVKVWLISNPEYVRLQIHDNGTKRGEIREGIGLLSIKSRSKSMGATVNIDNHSGFSIVVFVPLKYQGGKT
ncbi:putative signal transduction histidine kinase [Caldicellulosiruptor obsidiansis OB47]|mgnify:CR=1 FL=1|uniref:histidine kinase n=1 Tax=Caldicellulosiruptor obsidiansis (strain ATCC BAA-2073 / JCM 16842 / OB47) TaxID=608506 RepID=D9TH78_CALOO|nr:histidine kinase [Caldicellulosiruptor obsidiansis]ADL43475.1 putative signal transduction histidine kinase [Caldicellulosiruptor obsidiansis OB47]